VTVRIKRIYHPPEKADGLRVLVDGMWPRGIKKDEAQIDLWLKDIAPSAVLRQWFGHRPERWERFQQRYRAELSNNPAIVELQTLLEKRRRVTLLYAARDEDHNHAVVLADYLTMKRRHRGV